MPKELREELIEEEFTVKSQGKEFKFKKKILTWYEEEVILNQCSEIDKVKKVYVVNMPEMTLQTMLKSLIEAPFEINKKNLKELNKDVKNKIMKKIKPKRITQEQEKKSKTQ